MAVSDVQVFRVECEGGSVLSVDVLGVADLGSGPCFRASARGQSSYASTPRAAVAKVAAGYPALDGLGVGLPVVAVLAPGELTRAEAIAEAVREEREACANLCGAERERALENARRHPATVASDRLSVHADGADECEALIRARST